ncbi:MAG: SBBP repeat-containing protein, partial [Nitrospirae bacterium]|nr:SBBP repeat-containing protein [Nitrospirota bacterium]
MRVKLKGLMNVVWFNTLIIALLFCIHAAATTIPATGDAGDAAGGVKAADDKAISSAYMKLPLYFIENDGQVDKRVRFYEKGASHATWFTKDGVYVSLTKGETSKQQSARGLPPEKHSRGVRQETVKLSFKGANPNVEIVPEDMQDGRVNYFIGNDSAKWKTDVPTYRSILYRNVYDGIDVRFYGNNSQLEYDIIVSPGSSPDVVKMSYEGVKGLKVRGDGALELSLRLGKIIKGKPYIYQQKDGAEKVEVAGGFKILDRKKAKKGGYNYLVGFEVDKWDSAYALVLDPVLVYSTYVGGSGDDTGRGIAVDSVGNVYVTGATTSSNFPTTSAIQGTYAGGEYDAFVTKFSPTGTLVYSTYLGGSGNDVGYAIDVDSIGNAYITGVTYSSNFPTASALQATYGGGANDSFVVKLSPAGNTLVYSTYLEGNSNDAGTGIAVDSTGNAYITGETYSSNFPTASALQATYGGGTYDAFVTKFSPTGKTLVYSAYLGGSSEDRGYGIAVDSVGNAYITGWTASSNFPTVSVFQTTYGGGTYDAFVAKLSPTGNALVYSTYLGGSGDDLGNDIAVDSASNAYIAGLTNSSNFPTVSAFQTTYGGGTYDAFVAKLSPTGNALVYSTYLGGSGDDLGNDIAVDSSGNAYVIGQTASSNFPTTTSAFQATYGGGTSDVFVAKISPCTYTFTPTNKTFTSTGSNDSVGIAPNNSSCSWSASSNASWVTITSGSSGSGNGTVAYTVAANTDTTSRTGTITIEGQTFTVTQTGLDCSAKTITPMSKTFASTGGSDTVSVTANTGCAWTAVSNVSWITVTSGSSGSGNGTVGYTVAANTDTTSRTGTMTIAGQTFTVTQTGLDCNTKTITPTSKTFTSTGGSDTVSVTANTGCAWTAASNVSWITVTSGSSGSGNGTVGYTVAANTDTTSRTGTMAIAGQTFTVTQSGIDCSSKTIAPMSKTFASTGGNDSVTVTANTGCTWTAVSNVSWITVTSGSSGSGNGTVGYTVAANTSTSSRIGTITIAGQTFTVTQDGVVPCTYTLTPTSKQFLSPGGNGSVNITTTNDCKWAAASNATWITITSSGSGSGNATINYTVAANTGPTRNGTLTIAGQTFTVNQSGQDCATGMLINPTNRNFTSSGGSDNVSVTTPSSSCQWTATSNAAWIDITSGDAGTGNGQVSYTVSANTAATQRTGTITIAGQTFTVIQDSQTDSVTLTVTKQGTGDGTITTSTGSLNWSGNIGS